MLLPANIRKILVDGDQWAQWHGYQLPISTEYVTIWTPVGTEMHWKPGTWISEKHSLMYFWDHQWYTIQASYHPDGTFASGYCDVVLPTAAYTSTSQEIIYVDLYIDVVIRENFSVYTKDQEVFDRAAKYYPIVEESRQKSFEVLDWVEAQAKQWSGPFAIIPKFLPATNFEKMSPEEAHAVMRKVVKREPGE
jgi:protein associated with RNAse G/E